MPIKFFVPELNGVKEKGEELYQSIRRFAEQRGTVEERRIRSITFRDRIDKRRPVKATVGSPDPLEGDLVFAILESTDYFICTTNRGVRKGDPLMINKTDVSDVEEFER